MTPTELVGVPTWTTPTGEPRRFPIILGHEFSGEVAAVGDGVTDVAVGNPVYGLNDWFGDGARAEYYVARAAEVAPKPRSVDALVVFQICTFTGKYAMVIPPLRRRCLWYSFP
jgi:NADPH:quinone reductase-like Zn-dependent oxidoreductase